MPMQNPIAVYDGYGGHTKRRGHKRKKHLSGHHGGKAAQRNRFKHAAKHCKGRSQHAFRQCMKQQLKG